MTKEFYREVRAHSRTVAVSTAQHAQSKSAGSIEALKEQDMAQISSRPLRSQKSDQGQHQAQLQQSSSPRPAPEAHALSEHWHEPAPSRHSMADARWRPPTQKTGVIAGIRPSRKASVSHSRKDISGHRGPGQGHARLQHYWSALEEEGMLQGESQVMTWCHVRVSRTDPACMHALLQLLQACIVAKQAQQQRCQEVAHAGGAADGEVEQEWPRQEQRALCRACQEAAADGQLAEVVRLLQRPQLGQQVVDRDLAWHLVEVLCQILHLFDFTNTLLKPALMLKIRPGPAP